MPNTVLTNTVTFEVGSLNRYFDIIVKRYIWEFPPCNGSNKKTLSQNIKSATSYTSGFDAGTGILKNFSHDGYDTDMKHAHRVSFPTILPPAAQRVGRSLRSDTPNIPRFSERQSVGCFAPTPKFCAALWAAVGRSGYSRSEFFFWPQVGRSQATLNHFMVSHSLYVGRGVPEHTACTEPEPYRSEKPAT